MRKLIIFFIVINTFLLFSQEITVPVELQMKIFEKIIPLENNLGKSINEKKKINIVVLYQSRNRSSLLCKEIIVKYFIEQKESKLSINFLECNNETDIRNYLKRNKCNIVILTQLRAVEISSIADITSEYKVMSFSLVPEYVKKGISVGIDNIGDKPKIFINLEQSKREDVKFSSHLMKLAIIF